MVGGQRPPLPQGEGICAHSITTKNTCIKTRIQLIKNDGKPGNARRDGWEDKNKSRVKEFEKLRLPLWMRRHIQQLTPRFSKMVGFNLTAARVTIHCLKLCCIIMQFDTVIGYMRKKPQHGVKRVCKFLKWSVSFLTCATGAFENVTGVCMHTITHACLNRGRLQAEPIVTYAFQ